MDTNELLEKRRLLKRKKPVFLRQDAHKKKKVGMKWRKPKGSDSKMRVSFKGYRRSVRKGWKSPEAVRGTEATGMMLRIINNPSDLDALDLKKEAALIGSTVGDRKRLAIIEAALKKGIKISNFKEPQKVADNIKQALQKKRQEREETKKTREEKKEKAKNSCLMRRRRPSRRKKGTSS
jgi:large subunit ribosomal protein L32e